MSRWLAFAPGLGALATVVAVAGIARAPMAAEAEAVRAARAYTACMELARSSPGRAREEAHAWLAHGGGTPAAHCRAVALLGLGLHEDAARELERLGKDESSGEPAMRARLLRQAGNVWMIAGKPERARASFTEGLALAPSGVDLLIDRSIALANLGRDWDALDDLNDAIARDPERFEAFLFRATAYRRLGVLELAREDIGRALALKPADAEALLEHGNIMRLAGDEKAARASWRRVIDAAPGSPASVSASANLGRLERGSR